MWITLTILSLIIVVQLWVNISLLNRLLTAHRVPPLTLPIPQTEPEREPQPELRRKVASIPFMS